MEALLNSSQLQKAFTVREELFYTKTVACRKLLHRKLLHADVFTHGETFTHRKLLHMGTFYKQKLFQREAFCTESVVALNGNRMHKVLPSTTWNYKACTNDFPVYKTCTKYVPVLLYTYWNFVLWHPTHVHISSGAVCQTFFSKDQFWQFVMHPGRSVLIGRGSDCDVTLPYRGVSVHHALLRYRPVGISGSLLVQNHNLTDLSKPPNNRRKNQSLVIFLEYNLSHFLGSAALAISTISKRFSRPLGDSEPVMHLEDTSTNGTGMASGPDWLPIRKGQARALKSLGKFVVPFNRKPHQEAVPGNLWKSLEYWSLWTFIWVII